MDFKTPRASEPEAAGHTRFGESQFGPSRFGGHGSTGVWLEEGRPDAQGRVTGLYRTGTSEGTVTGLTVVRTPTLPPPSPAPKPQADKPAGPRVLNLPGGRRGVLLFHGLTSTPLELQFLARGLHRAGYSVRVAVIEGYSHGLSSPAPSGHREWATAAIREFDHMRSQCDALAVGGLCIGALLSLHVAASRPAAVSHILALSTTLHYDGWAAPRSRWLLPLARMIPALGRMAVKEREPFGLKDERLRAWVAAQMRESGGSDAGAAVLKVRDLLEAQNLMRLVRQGIKQIKAPTLLLHARDDDAASPRSAFEVASSVSSERVLCRLLNDSYHMISIDKEKNKVLAEMKDFLQGAPGGPEGSAAPVTPAMTTTQRNTQHVRA